MELLASKWTRGTIVDGRPCSSPQIGTGAEIYVPMRIVANGSGAEALLTLFKQPGMSDATYAADADWVRRDLLALAALATRQDPH